MTKTTTNPLTLARLITAMAEQIEALHTQFTDYAVDVEELKETNEGVTRYEYADTHANRAMACLYNAERHMEEIAKLLQH